MSLPPDSLAPIPPETARIAHAAFPQGSLAITLRDVFGSLYHDGMFADLYSSLGQHALAPWRLALVTVLQYAENLSDQQAADAVRGRIDWKYALALPLAHAGFDASDLSTFRERLVAGQAEDRLLWALVEAGVDRGLLRKRGRLRTDATQVLAAVRTLNRLELVGETLRAALEALAVAAPDWVREHLPVAWVERYGRQIEDRRLPERATARTAWAEATGHDGVSLLALLDSPTTPSWLRDLPCIGVLRHVWEQHYAHQGEQVRWWGTPELAPAGERLQSPYDPDARYGEKRGQGWVGSKVHLTESCEADLPSLIVGIQTTDAATADALLPPRIWADLATRALLPTVHLLDAGYVTVPHLVTAQDQDIELVGPMQPDVSWQARANDGYAASDFAVDWEQEEVRCPQGKTSHTWVPTADGRGGQVVRIRFARADCQDCPARPRCTTSRTAGRTLTLPPTAAQYHACQEARQRQETAAFREQYRHRAGIEGTISQAIRRTGLRQARYRGQAKLHLQHCAEAAALNVIRLADYFAETPRAHTRRSHLVQVLAPAA